MAGRHEADVDLTDADGLVVGDGLPVLRAVAHLHDRQRLRRCQHRRMPAARMIRVAVGDHRLRLGLRRVDPRIGGAHIDALGVGLDPGT